MTRMASQADRLQEVKSRIVGMFRPLNPERILLFGSLARGEWDEHSDIDLIIVYRTEKRFLDRLKELYLVWDLPKAVDILAYTPDEFERMKQENAFVQLAVEEGETLYEAI